MSSSMAALRELNPWLCRDKAVIPVPAPAIPRPNVVAMVMAVRGSLLTFLRERKFFLEDLGSIFGPSNHILFPLVGTESLARLIP